MYDIAYEYRIVNPSRNPWKAFQLLPSVILAECCLFTVHTTDFRAVSILFGLISDSTVNCTKFFCTLLPADKTPSERSRPT